MGRFDKPGNWASSAESQAALSPTDIKKGLNSLASLLNLSQSPL